MRKLTKKSLDEMAKTMNVIPVEERDYYWGMYSGDCFWRCVAWLATGDSSEAAAASYALEYWADYYGCYGTAYSNLSNNGAGMPSDLALSYRESHSSIPKNTIYCFDTGTISGFGNIEGWHYLVRKSGDADTTTLYDPQNNITYTINNSELRFSSDSNNSRNAIKI